MSRTRTIAAPVSASLPLIGRVLTVAPRVLTLWSERRRERLHLARLDAHLLKDVGLDGRFAEEEASKPFWRG